MAEIFCVRHGQASFGSEDYDQLSETGYLQARLLGTHLSQSGVKLDAIICGSLKRQIQTAQGVVDIYREQDLEVPEIQVDERWNELRAGAQIKAFLPVLTKTQPELQELLKTSRTDTRSLQKLIEASFRYWAEEKPKTDELESWQQVNSRIRAALSDITDNYKSGSTTAVFSSGGTISIAAAAVLGLPDDRVYPLYEQLMNASMTKIIYTRDKLTLKSYNEHSYLDAVGSQAGHNNVVTFR